MQTKLGFFISALSMLKINRTLITGIVITTVVIITCKPLSAEYLAPEAYQNFNLPLFQYANANLWQYLREGLNYLESPQPLSSPEKVSLKYVHPDLRGFGAYGFSPEAYQDVQRIYPFFKQYSWEDILSSYKLYDLANQAFADWLLKNLLDYIPKEATQEEVFDLLHRAWNLGLRGFKNGREVIASRVRRAEEFKASRLR
jgi:hypothetical protein